MGEEGSGGGEEGEGRVGDSSVPCFSFCSV